jgi:hypothetical protein
MHAHLHIFENNSSMTNGIVIHIISVGWSLEMYPITLALSGIAFFFF